MAKKTLSFFSFSLITFCITYTLLNPYKTAFYAQGAIKMCATSLVPTLFIFMVFSRMLSHLCTSDFSENGVMRFFSRILNLPPRLIPICISGLFCGAPSGAFAICRLYNDGYCSKEECEKACILANNCSASFILGFIPALLGTKVGCFYIFLANIITVIIVYIIFFRKATANKGASPIKEQNKHSIYETLTESISSSVTATITLCGYVIFFYTFTQVLCENLKPFFKSLPLFQEHSEFILCAVSSFFEISSGVLRTGTLHGTRAIVLCSGAVAFTGLSMIFQVLSILAKHGISAKGYFFSKCLCALIAPIIVTALMLLSPSSLAVSVYNSSQINSGVSSGDIISLAFITCIAFAGAYLLFCLDKKHKK